MTKQKLFLYLLFLVGMAQSAMAQEPYAVLNKNNTVLTFYYDTQKTARGGMSVGPFENQFTTSWYPHRETIATVVFDASFADCTSLTSTACWFEECTKLNTISGIENLKTDNVTDMNNMFRACSSLTSLDVSGFKTENVTDMRGMFGNCSSLTSLDLSGFKTDKVMDMTLMFGYCSSLTTIYVSNNWSTEKVTYGRYMFDSCTKLVGGQGTAYYASHTDHTYARIDGGTATPGYFTDKNMPKPMPYAVLSNDGTVLTFYYDAQKDERGGMSVGPFENQSTRSWHPQRETIATVVFDASFANCTSLTSTAYWFYGCTKLNTISGIENLKTENVTNMSNMFRGCSSLTSLDLSNFKTDKVTDMSCMFFDCWSLTSLDVSGFKTDNVTNMMYMFDACERLTSLDLSGFKTENVTYISYMFYGCSSLTTIYASNNWSTEKVTDGGYMFTDCTKLVGGQGTAYDENHTDYTYARIDGGTATPGYFTDSNMKPMPYAVLSNDNTVLTFYYDTQKAARGGMSVGPFERQSTRSWHPQRETIATVVFDASFADCTSLTSTAAWFYGCTNLNTISGFENLKTENVTNMNSMFSYCGSLYSLDLSNFKTDKVTDMSCMFSVCASLTSLDLSGFKTDKVTNMRGMFLGCSSLTTIYASNNWSTEKVTNGDYMFNDCTQLVGGQGTAYDASHTDHTYARIDGGTAALGYFTEKSGTGIRGLNADSNADNAPVYDLSGRRVQVPAKGIYVKNGKKFVNK